MIFFWELSFTSFFTTLLFSNIIIITIWTFLKNSKAIGMADIGCALFCIALEMIRLLIPIELDASKNINCSFLLPDIVSFLNFYLIPIGSGDLRIYHILYTVWGIGSIIGFTRTYVIYRKFEKSICYLPDEMSRRVQPILQKVLKKYSKPASFRIMLSPTLTTPLIFKIKTPTIVLPKNDLSDDELFYIFSHEVEHHYNHDLLVKVITELLCFLYWWNPLVFLLKKQVSKVIELHTDINAIKSMDEMERINYMNCILKIAKNRRETRSETLLPALSGNNDSTLKQRFYVIMDSCNLKPTRKRLKNIFLVAIFVLALIVSSFSFVFKPYFSLPEDDAENTFEFTKATAYLVQNNDNGYDVYLNDNYFATTNKIQESFSHLPIYTNLSEVQKNESN